jgi:protocatechuate 3,4-dioxygenase beta subunit
LSLRVLTIFQALALSVAFAPSQDERVISGQVVDAASGKPVAGATVTISGSAIARSGPWGPDLKGGAPQILTAGDGRFVFTHLPGGTFSVTVRKTGYVVGGYGRRRPGGPMRDVDLSGAHTSSDISIPIWKTAAISGTLTDESGEAIVAAQLMLWRATIVSGTRRFVASGQVLTDDRGLYRFGNLVPGDYIVGASAPRISTRAGAKPTAVFLRGNWVFVPQPSTAVQIGDAIYPVGRPSIVPPSPTDGHLMVYPTTFHPSTRSPGEATVITLASGEERSAVDLQVEPVPAARVTGTLIGSDGPVGGASVQLRGKGLDAAAPGDDLVTVTDDQGRFVFPGVPTGDYTLSARHQASPATRLSWIDMPISVGGDLDDLVGVLRPGIRIAGRLEYQGAAPPPRQPSGAFQPAPFVLDAADGSETTRLNSAASGAAGFVLEGFTSGKYVVRVPPSPQGWMFKSAVIKGVDVSETPFELTADVTDLVITFTDQWSGLGGTVHDANGNPDGSATVVVFPTNVESWRNYGPVPRRLKSTAPNAQGEFGISSLPPGDYYAVAIPEDQSDDWRDPKTLDALARIATTVTIAEGEHRMIDLRTKVVPR